MLNTLLYFIIALFLLITIHEFGHFMVARMCGVKVLRFSFGFGKVLASWRDKRGTEFSWSLIPLGGYVKMLDEAEGDVPESEQHLAFNRQPIWARIAIILAGPLFNFLFALLALWLVWMIGIQSLAPMIASVKPGSLAETAGLMPGEEIIALGKHPVDSWRDFQYALMPVLGTDQKIPITVKSLSSEQTKTVLLSMQGWQINAKDSDLLASLGVTPFIPTISPVAGKLIAGSPAQLAGLKRGDLIQAVDGQPVSDWLSLVKYVKLRPNETVVLAVSRDGLEKEIKVQVGSAIVKGKTQGFLGVFSQKPDWPATWLRIHQKYPLEAFGAALSQTIHLTGSTFVLIGRLLTGNLSLQSLSGPIGIAQGAGDSAQSGLAYYLSFLAMVSISLGVLNLLPIPILDGGHLLYCLIEVVMRRPVPDAAKSVSIYLGLVALISLMVVALSNDLSRLSG